MRFEPCRDCGRMMRWAVTISQARMPLDDEPDNERGNVTIGADGLARVWGDHEKAWAAAAEDMVPQTWMPHRATCEKYARRAHAAREEHPSLF